MASLDDSATPSPSAAEAPSALATPLNAFSSSRRSSASGSGRLSPGSVNQRVPEGGPSKVSRLALSSSKVKPDTSTMETSQLSTASGENEAPPAANTALSASGGSPSTDRKGNGRTHVGGAPLASPRTPRTPRSSTTTATTTITATAAVLRSRGSAARKSEEALDSPPVVPVTATRRLAKTDAAPVEENSEEPQKPPSAEPEPLRSPRAALTSVTPLLSPRRRLTAAKSEEDGKSERSVPPKTVVSPRPTKGAETAEESDEPKALEATAHLASEETTAVEKRTVHPATGKASKASPPPFSPSPEEQSSLVTASPPLSPRQRDTSSRTNATAAAAHTVQSSLRASPSPTSTATEHEDKERAVPAGVGKEAAKEKTKEAVNTVAASEGSKEASPAALATPRGSSMASRVEEIRARLAASRQRTSASIPTTPRSSAGSVAITGAASGLKDNTASATATAAVEAASTIKELKQTLKDKDKELALLAKEKAKVEQLLEKATKKSEELQEKWEAEKTAFATYKKDATAVKLEAQKETRQAQTAARVAQASQEKLQRELEKQKEKLAAVPSRVTSASTTPLTTPRGAPLSASNSTVTDAGDAAMRLKLARVEKENAALRESVAALEVASAAAVETARAEAEVQKAELQRTANEEAEKLRWEVSHLAEALSARDAALKSKMEETQTLTAEMANVKREHEEKEQRWEQEKAEKLVNQQQQERSDASTNTTEDFTAAPTALPEPRGQVPLPSSSPSPPRSPRQVVTFELSAKEATAHLQEELTATQHQVSAYKRMQEHADRRIEQLETELTAMQQRARDAVAALQTKVKEESERRAVATSDATALEAIKKELEEVRVDFNALKQTAQEAGEEAVTLRSALEEAEDERDVYERQLRDLQQEHGKFEWEAQSAMEKLTAKTAAELKEVQGLLDITHHALHDAEEASQLKDGKLAELQAQVEGLQSRCNELERQADEAKQSTEATNRAAEDAQKQVEHHKRRSKTLTKKLAEAEKELQVLGEDYSRVRDERDAAVLRCRVDEAREQPMTIEREHQQNEQAKGNLSLHSDGVPIDSVSRDLSDALLSAKRIAPSRLGVDNRPTTTTTATATGTAAAAAAATTPTVTAAFAQEQQARAHLQKEVTALQTKVAAIEQLASPILHSIISDSVESLPSVEAYEFDVQQPPSCRRGISEAPPRARSPQTTHALDLRFFDPTRTDPAPPTTGQSSDRLAAAGPSRSASQSAAVVRVSPRRSHIPAALSPQRHGGPVSTGTAGDYHTKESALDAVYAEVPPPPVYRPAHENSTDVIVVSASGGDGRSSLPSSATAARRLDLLFSTTAGCLLVSKRGRQLHRPQLVNHGSGSSSANDQKGRGEERRTAETTACCAALASMSHAIYASRMSAAGLYHLQHRYRYVIRVLTDCDAVEVLLGFADRYVPLESFGVNRNAVHYKGCYYLSLQGGRLYAPSQGVRGEAYAGWASAAETAAARRWQTRGGPLRGIHDITTAAAPSVPSSTSPPACVARAGDEIACVLRLDERSISFEWNGLDCGVAFTGVLLAPSLYPCVEVNGSGGTVELL